MNQRPTVTYFFLGANSKDGFYSLYDQFPSKENDTLHIIKSGPGTGKSTFMKRIGTEAESRGLDVEYILCSGDPHSLDGVYIPALHTGWVDGTAPHILEPKHFGIDGVYVDLGQFCKRDRLADSITQIKAVTSAYRLCYQKAYMYLQSAGNLTNKAKTVESYLESRIRSRARSKIKKELAVAAKSSFRPVKRFLRAISCLGNYSPPQTLNALCDRICILESHYHLEDLFFEEILSEADSRNIYYILCPDPLSPHRTEAVIFPDIGLCFIAAVAAPPFNGKTRMIHLDTYLESFDKSEYKQQERFKLQLMDAAYKQLSRAKQYHDELEQYYRPALDTDALDTYTNAVIKDIFS